MTLRRIMVFFVLLSLVLTFSVLAEGQKEGAEGAEELTELTFWSATAAENPTVTKIYSQDILRNFERENPEIKVNLELTSYDVMRQKLMAAVNANNPPDIAEAGGLGLRFVLDGQAENLKPYIDANPEVVADMTPGVRAVFEIQDGEIWWGLPWRGGCNAFGGHKEILADHGYTKDDITTWSEFMDAAQKMTNPREQLWGMAVYGVSWDLEQYWGVMKTFAENPGDDMFMKRVGVGKYEPNMLQPRTKGGTRFYVDWVTEYEITHPSSPSLSDEDAATLLGKKEVAMLTQIGDRRYKLNFPEGYEKGHYIAWPIPKLTKELGERYGSRYPELVGQEGHHGGQLWQYEQAQVVFDHPEESFKVLAYGLKPENILAIAVAYGQAPTVSKSALEKILSGDYDVGPVTRGQTNALLEYADNYTVTGWPIGETDTIRWDTINTNISSAIAGEMSTDEALEKTQKEIADILAGK